MSETGQVSWPISTSQEALTAGPHDPGGGITIRSDRKGASVGCDKMCQDKTFGGGNNYPRSKLKGSDGIVLETCTLNVKSVYR